MMMESKLEFSVFQSTVIEYTDRRSSSVRNTVFDSQTSSVPHKGKCMLIVDPDHIATGAQILNLSGMDTKLPDNAPIIRKCHVIMWPDFKGYGFNLHSEKTKPGQFIGKVDSGSPAERAGLHRGDRIIEVNDVNISNENHNQVVQRIKAHPDETKLLVVDEATENFYREHNIVITGSLPSVKYMSSRRDVDNEDVNKIETLSNEDGEHDKRSMNSMNSEGSAADKETSSAPPPPPPLYEESEENQESESEQVSKEDQEEIEHDQDRKAAESEEEDRVDELIDAPRVVVEAPSPPRTPSPIEERTPTPPPPLEESNPTLDNSDDLIVREQPVSSSEQEEDRIELADEQKAFGGSSTTSDPSPRDTPSPGVMDTSMENSITAAPQNMSQSTDKKNWGGLNLNMSVAEMREKLSSKKKYDPRKERNMDFMKKHEIIKQL